MPELIALDSNIFIAALTGNEKCSPAAQKLLRDIALGRHEAIASSIAYGEVLGLSRPGAGGDDTLDVASFFASISHLLTIAADDDICLRAGELRKKYGGAMKLPDALHLATALKHKADCFMTDDERLARIASKLIPTKTLAKLN